MSWTIFSLVLQRSSLRVCPLCVNKITAVLCQFNRGQRSNSWWWSEYSRHIEWLRSPYYVLEDNIVYILGGLIGEIHSGNKSGTGKRKKPSGPILRSPGRPSRVKSATPPYCYTLYSENLSLVVPRMGICISFCAKSSLGRF